tara:strand:- start:63 stop:356 length:294 start_codon:yes stop_codon:yes gene_type:complete
MQILEIDPTGWSTILRVGFLAACCTWGLAEALKPQLRRLTPDGWPRAGVRIGALGIGSAAGWLCLPSGMGAVIGFAGGALSAAIVAAVKRVLDARST